MLDRVFEHRPGAVITEHAWQAASCDPCPTNALTRADLEVFGTDVVGDERVSRYSNPWVLTRLHARVDATDDSDLVFRPASGIVGGRGAPFRSGYLRQRVETGGGNAYQARYAILHHPASFRTMTS